MGQCSATTTLEPTSCFNYYLARQRYAITRYYTLQETKDGNHIRRDSDRRPEQNPPIYKWLKSEQEGPRHQGDAEADVPLPSVYWWTDVWGNINPTMPPPNVFSTNQPLGRFVLKVAMSVCMSPPHAIVL